MIEAAKVGSVGLVWFVVGALTWLSWEAMKTEQDQEEAQGRAFYRANPITMEQRDVLE